MFDATAPLMLSDKTQVYPMSSIFPQAVPFRSCAAAAGLLQPAANFIVVDVSSACHPIVRSRPFPGPHGIKSKLTLPVKPGESKLYTDGHGACGPLKMSQVAVKGTWTAY